MTEIPAIILAIAALVTAIGTLVTAWKVKSTVAKTSETIGKLDVKTDVIHGLVNSKMTKALSDLAESKVEIAELHSLISKLQDQIDVLSQRR